MKKGIKMLMLLFMFVFGLTGVGQYASALETVSAKTAAVKNGWVTSEGCRLYYSKSGKITTGWAKISGKYYYFRKSQENGVPKGAMSVGVCKINGKYFYFDEKGVLQTGWQKIGGKLYYFEPTGVPGKLGERYSGIRQIGNNTFRFNKNGRIYTGWYEEDGKTRFYSKSSTVGKRGKMAVGWTKIAGVKYYFDTNGVLQKNSWIDKTYYVDENGMILKACVTPDGYVVDADGVRQKKAQGWIEVDGEYYYYKSGKKLTGWQTISNKRYYFNKSGVRVKGWLKYQGDKYYLKKGVMLTGWQKISGKDYYFGTDGKMAVSTEVDGITIAANGVADMSSKKPSVLIVAGHGQGDCGAIGEYPGKTWYEADLTREFASLIYTKLKNRGASQVYVSLYDMDYNLYSVNLNHHKYQKVTGPLPEFEKYDYILEIHFNATGSYLKDVYGNGSYKGIGMYVNSAKADTRIDSQIVQAAASVGGGFKIWAGGLLKSSTLYNAQICQALGVSYGLLETAFIDDRDDMNFYNMNKEKMADAIAKTIITNLK